MMINSRKWKAVLLLAAFYGIAIGLKFILVVKSVQIQLIASFDETVKWAMLGLGGTVGSYIFAISKEKQYKSEKQQTEPKILYSLNEKSDRISHNTTLRTPAVTEEQLKKIE